MERKMKAHFGKKKKTPQDNVVWFLWSLNEFMAIKTEGKDNKKSNPLSQFNYLILVINKYPKGKISIFPECMK